MTLAVIFEAQRVPDVLVKANVHLSVRLGTGVTQCQKRSKDCRALLGGDHAAGNAPVHRSTCDPFPQAMVSVSPSPEQLVVGEPFQTLKDAVTRYLCGLFVEVCLHEDTLKVLLCAWGGGGSNPHIFLKLCSRVALQEQFSIINYSLHALHHFKWCNVACPGARPLL